MYTIEYLDRLENFIVDVIGDKIGETDELDLYVSNLFSGTEIIWPPCFEVEVPNVQNDKPFTFKFEMESRDGGRVCYSARDTDKLLGLYIGVTLHIADSLDMFDPDHVYCYTREVSK